MPRKPKKEKRPWVRYKLPGPMHRLPGAKWYEQLPRDSRRLVAKHTKRLFLGRHRTSNLRTSFSRVLNRRAGVRDYVRLAANPRLTAHTAIGHFVFGRRWR